jgi:hypothetical protein
MKQLAQTVFIEKPELAVRERRLANMALNAMFRPRSPFLVRGGTNEVGHGTPYRVWWTILEQRAITDCQGVAEMLRCRDHIHGHDHRMGLPTLQGQT